MAAPSISGPIWLVPTNDLVLWPFSIRAKFESDTSKNVGGVAI